MSDLFLKIMVEKYTEIKNMNTNLSALDTTHLANPSFHEI